MQTVYPNPFNTVTTITYSVLNPALINISIYNTQGQKIKVLVDRYQEVGTYSIQWKGEDERENQVPDGLYFCQINWDNFSQSVKLMLLK
jgi:flagellar hook assembly protein FlgD